MAPASKKDTRVAKYLNCVVQLNHERWRDRHQSPVAAADSSAAGQAGLCPGQGVASRASAGRGDREERGLCAAQQRGDPGGLRLAGARDRRAGWRGSGLRGRAGRRAGRCRAAPDVRRHPQRGLCAPGRGGACACRAPRRRERRQRAGRHRQPGGPPAQAVERDRRHRLLRSRRARGCRAADRPRREPSEPRERSHDPATGPIRDAADRQQDLGDARARADRPHRLGLADPPLHRRGGALQVRARPQLRAARRRGALRHVRGRVHPRGRPLHLRGAGAARRPRRSGAWAPSARSSTTST